MRLARLFFNVDAIREVNKTYKKRMAEIDEKAELDALSIEAAKLANKERLREKLAANNAKLKEAWSK